MKFEKIATRLFWITVCIGFIVSSISYLENSMPWLAALCGIFGSGCSEAAEFTLFMIPVAIWGMVFYLVLAAVYRFAPSWAFSLVMAGAGAEATFIWLMLSRHIVCIFCLINAIVITVLLILFIKRLHLWQCLALFLLGYIVSSSLLTIENPMPGISPAGIKSTSIVAQVRGIPITMSDLESGISSKLYKMRNEIYLLKRDHLEKLIWQILSGRQGILLKNNVEKNPASEIIPDTPMAKAARRILIDTLRNNPHIDQYLDKPTLPFSRIPVGNSPSSGPIDAPVTVIEFSDYLCPACKWAHPISKQIKDIYKGKIRWVFKDFPLKRHPGADKLANAAHCAGEQGKFWEFQDLLFDAKQHPDDVMISQFVQILGLNYSQFNQCFKSGKYADDVAKDKSDASMAGVTMTPSFIINGRLIPGSLTLDNFKQRVDEALQQSRE
jgi:protein-disulfide isomerase